MTKTHETPTHEYFLDYFQGQPVRIMRDRKTGEILFNLSNVAKCLGYESTEAMMSDDQILDSINKHKQQTGESPLRKL